jgi:hypothetical protein
MLRHPFFGVIVPDQQPPGEALEAPAVRGAGRRTFFRQALAVAVGAGAFLLGRSSQAQQASVQIVPGSSGVLPGGGRSSVIVRRSGGTVTTQAVGEEGGVTVPGRPREPIYTTQAVGEEGGWYYPPRRPPHAVYPPPSPPQGTVTTYALGEEGSYYRPPVYRPPPYEPPTTLALGEEGGGYYRRY